MKQKFRVSPSQIGRYFFHHCERFFRYSATTYGNREAEGVPEQEFERSWVMRQVLEEGARWEERVLEDHLQEQVLVAPGDGALSERYWSVEKSIEMLKVTPAGKWIYQPTLRVPPGFYERYGIDPELVLMSDCRPDLIWVRSVNGRRQFVVTDVKRGESLRPTYRVQVLMYALILEALLEDEGMGLEVATDEGAVWLGGQSEATLCALEQLKPHVVDFLQEEMPALLAQPVEEVPWHIQYRCEWCEYHGHCDAEMRREEDVSQLTRLSSYGKRFLADTLDIRSLTDLRAFLQQDDSEVDSALSACASLAGTRPYLEAKSEALLNGELQAYGSRTALFPKFSHLKVFLTLQWEPIGDTIFFAGMRVHASNNVPAMVVGQFGAQEQETATFLAESPEDGVEVRRRFVEELYELLSRVDGYNASRDEWKEQLSVQVIVYSHRERSLLERMLLEALDDDEIADRAMSLLLFLATPELIHLGDQPGEDPAGNPVTVLLDGISRLFAVPVPVSYTLPETLAAFGNGFYERSDTYHFPLGHGLRSDTVHRAWFGGEPDGLEQFRRQAWLFLRAVESLFWKAYFAAKDHGLLDDWPPKFKLPSSTKIQDPLLSRLAFFARYESLSRCTAVKEARDTPLEVQFLNGRVLELEALEQEGKFAVRRGTMDVDESNWGNWIMVPASEAGRHAARSYPDYYARGAAVRWIRPHPNRAVAKVPVIERDEFGVPLKLTIRYFKEFQDRTIRPGDRFLLYDRFSDYTTDRVIDFLEKLDDSPPGLFRQLLEEPDHGLTARPLADGVAECLDEIRDSLALSPSKQAAFDAICAQTGTVVWGPPGTGKTYFLAATICALYEAHARANQPFRVMVTAFTHAAIENLLREIGKVASDLGLHVPVCKLGEWHRDAAGDTIEGKGALEGYHRMAPQTIVGTTVYQLAKENLETVGLDLVVIDEASQVRVPEAAIPAAFCGDRGRIVFAGDDYQLPPIVAGTYTDPKQGPVLHRSVFEALLRRDDHGHPSTEVVHQLRENYRMNDVLTSLARNLLYPGYQCATPQIEERRLAISAVDDGLLRWLLDPAFPVAVVVVEGVRAAKENDAEAALVTRLSTALRDTLPYHSDKEFWRKGLFVVSPHRAQNRLIRRMLGKAREWESTPFVDTVDKMQGQEADAVIISYGVADPEFAVNEAEFIYSRNRLNVSMTRAKTKSILVLSRPLLEPLPEVLENDVAAAGLAYMRGTVQRVRETGESLAREWDNGCVLKMYRAGEVFL